MITKRNLLNIFKTTNLPSVGNESQSTSNLNLFYNREEYVSSVRDFQRAYTGLEDASQVLEEMKKVIVQHEANVQAEKAEEDTEGVGETEDGQIAADVEPTSDEGNSEGTDGIGGGDAGESSEGDAGTGEEGDLDMDLGDGSDDNTEGEGEGDGDNNEEDTSEDNQGETSGEGTQEVEEGDVEKASEEKESAEESAKEMNMAGEMLSGALFGARYKDLKSVIGIKSIGLNNISTSPLYAQQEALSDMKEVKETISSYFKSKVSEFNSNSKECLTKAKEELEDILTKTNGLLKSIESKDVTEGSLPQDVNLKPFTKILLQANINKDNLVVHFEKTLPVIKSFMLDSNRLNNIFQTSKSVLDSKQKSDMVREKLFWEFVRPLYEVSRSIQVDPISQYTEKQGKDVHVSRQDMLSNGLSLRIRPIKADFTKEGIYNSLTNAEQFGTYTVLYPDIDIDDNIPLTKVKELCTEICLAIQASASKVVEALTDNLNSIKALEEFNGDSFGLPNETLDDIISGLSVIVYDQTAFTLAILSKLRKSLESAAVLTNTFNIQPAV